MNLQFGLERNQPQNVFTFFLLEFSTFHGIQIQYNFYKWLCLHPRETSVSSIHFHKKNL